MLRVVSLEAVGYRDGLRLRVESPTRWVCFVEAGLEPLDARRALPLHWRAGDWSKPPIDIEVDPTSGLLLNVQLVLQDERVLPRCARPVGEAEAAGVPRFDVSTWARGERYQDETMCVTIAWSAVDSLYMEFESVERANRIDVAPCLAMFVTGVGRCVGIEMVGLDHDELRHIARAVIGTP